MLNKIVIVLIVCSWALIYLLNDSSTGSLMGGFWLFLNIIYFLSVSTFFIGVVPSLVSKTSRQFALLSMIAIVPYHFVWEKVVIKLIPFLEYGHSAPEIELLFLVVCLTSYLFYVFPVYLLKRKAK